MGLIIIIIIVIVIVITIIISIIIDTFIYSSIHMCCKPIQILFRRSIPCTFDSSPVSFT